MQNASQDVPRHALFAGSHDLPVNLLLDRVPQWQQFVQARYGAGAVDVGTVLGAASALDPRGELVPQIAHMTSLLDDAP